jgi:hypothetical protein
VHKQFRDNQSNRVISYNFAADKGYFYTTYDLYLLIRGTNGTNGTSGGSNGVGGQGGYNGNLIAMNPETNEHYQINLLKSGRNSGENGKNGQVGKSGICGKHGNDMVLIDRSAKEPSKHYIGSHDRKLNESYVYKAEKYSRLDGVRRYVEKENACFIKFENSETSLDTRRCAAEAKLNTTRKTSNEAIAKESIVVSNVLSEAKSIFGKHNALHQDKSRSKYDDEAEEEEEATENVAEEVTVIRQAESLKKVSEKINESGKKVFFIFFSSFIHLLKICRYNLLFSAKISLLTENMWLYLIEESHFLIRDHCAVI